MDERAVPMQCTTSLNGQDAGPGDTPFGVSSRLGIRQRSLVCLLLHCFHFLSIFWERNGGCSGVCIVLHSILGQATHQTMPVNTP